MKINPMLLGILCLTFFSTTTFAQSNKEKVVACKNAKIAKLVRESRGNLPDVIFGAHCEPGNIQGFPPHCGGIENNSTPASIAAR